MRFRPLRRGVVCLALGALGLSGCEFAGGTDSSVDGAARPAATGPATPIEHLVVIIGENISFDHYFGTYPRAANAPGQPAFHPLPGTPKVNGLTRELLENNPNAVNPFRLDRSEAITCDNIHTYRHQQLAYNGGRMDRFVENVGPREDHCDPVNTMGYYDGNTVTAMWNYAQRFAMSDNSYDATFGPSLLGHLNLVAGQTRGELARPGSQAYRPWTAVANVAAAYEDCAPRRADTARMGGRNVGDLLSAAGVSWGWFSQGFRPTGTTPDGRAICGASSRNRAGVVQPDYYRSGIAEPFQYWRSTANPHHVPPRSVEEIGHAGRANHQYDLIDFWRAADAGRLPAVSFIKPGVSVNGHPETSDPLSEQQFLVTTINRLQRLPSWPSTAVVVAYDDSDGWYDHQAAPITNPSRGRHDALDGEGRCGSGEPLAGINGRCGPGPRQPLLVISPYAKRNFVDHTLTTQVSILRFIEDNWLRGQRLGGGSFDATARSITGLFDFSRPDTRPLMLDPKSGLPLNGSGR